MDDELIRKRDAVREIVKNHLGHCDYKGLSYECYRRAIEDVCGVKPVNREQVVGEWIDDEEGNKYAFLRPCFRCSVCGEGNTYGNTKYCMHCGAKMKNGGRK